jgi:hypothetical protein
MFTYKDSKVSKLLNNFTDEIELDKDADKIIQEGEDKYKVNKI